MTTEDEVNWGLRESYSFDKPAIAYIRPSGTNGTLQNSRFRRETEDTQF